MGCEVGGYSYVDQQRNLLVAMNKRELMRAVSEKIVDADIAAASLQEAEDVAIRRVGRNR